MASRIGFLEAGSGLARERLLARADVPSERDAIAAALQDAEREGASLARAIQKGGKLEASWRQPRRTTRGRSSYARLARLDASPTVALDGRRKLAEIEHRAVIRRAFSPTNRRR
jgi:hypothetical protein